MVIYELNDAQRAESIYFEIKEVAIRTGAGICYGRYKGSFIDYIDALNDNLKYKDISIEPIIIY